MDSLLLMLPSSVMSRLVCVTQELRISRKKLSVLNLDQGAVASLALSYGVKSYSAHTKANNEEPLHAIWIDAPSWLIEQIDSIAQEHKLSRADMTILSLDCGLGIIESM